MGVSAAWLSPTRRTDPRRGHPRGGGTGPRGRLHTGCVTAVRDALVQHGATAVKEPGPSTVERRCDRRQPSVASRATDHHVDPTALDDPAPTARGPRRRTRTGRPAGRTRGCPPPTGTRPGAAPRPPNAKRTTAPTAALPIPRPRASGSAQQVRSAVPIGRSRFTSSTSPSISPAGRFTHRPRAAFVALPAGRPPGDVGRGGVRVGSGRCRHRRISGSRPTRRSRAGRRAGRRPVARGGTTCRR